MSVIWELDFYSRPVVDEEQKKLWEVLICETPLGVNTPTDSLFRFSKFCSNTEVNSVWVRKAIEEAIAQAQISPDKIRFFRRQMANMITKACDDAGIPVYASRRTLTLYHWLHQRMQEVYPTLPNYKPGANPSVSLAPSVPQPLPDALLGEKWAFVTLEAGAFADMPEWQIDFGEAFPLEIAGITPDTPIPGLIIFSSRSRPLAGWMSGLDLAFLTLDQQKTPRLVLETGGGEAWVLANLTSPPLKAEAEKFEAAKRQAQHVHFLAVQSDPDSDSFAGFWLMQELDFA